MTAAQSKGAMERVLPMDRLPDEVHGNVTDRTRAIYHRYVIDVVRNGRCY